MESEMEIKNPRRILAVGAPESGVLKLLQELTGSAPTPTAASTAGLSHEWRLETKYYATTLPIWVDEIPNVAEWRTEFVKPEAKEVISVLGAWIYCFRKPVTEADRTSIRDTMQAISDVIEHACGYGGDQVCLAVAMPQSTTPYLDVSPEEWEELAMEYGFEYIDAEQTNSTPRNEFGEKVGVHRVKEALEAGEWESMDGFDFGDDEDGLGGFETEEAEMNMELFGMKDALHHRTQESRDEDESKEVEELEVMMRKMVAIKEMGEGMEQSERKRFAAKAVNDLMKDL